jgi:hemerythrin-like domain-containing protein
VRPTDILSDEHRVIEQVLACLERLSENAEKQGRLDAPSAREAVDFFRNFADRCHHGKEETHFFPAVEAKGFPREGGPTGVMLYEHDLGRGHVRVMDGSIDAAAGGDPEALRRFIDNARAYVELLRQHIDKEDRCLFAMADQALGAEDQRRLLEAFEKIEAEEVGAGTHEKYLEVANRLADRFGVSRAAAGDAEAARHARKTGHGMGDISSAP